jgi:catalase
MAGRGLRFLADMLLIRRVEFRFAEVPILAIPVLLVAHDGAALRTLADRLTAAGAVPRVVGSRFGPVPSVQGDPIEVDVTVEAMPSVLYDAFVLPYGDVAVRQLSGDGRVLEFLKDQYRHCKPILVLGGSSVLLDAASIPKTLPDGSADPGLVREGASDGSGSAAEAGAPVVAFMSALARHRVFARETDPPAV